jgi:hypothetical protein
MSETDLIDNIVSNETLGIKKKPSLLKSLAVVAIAACVTFLGYSFYMKSKSETAQPPLDLGQSNPITQAQAAPEQVPAQALMPVDAAAPVNPVPADPSIAPVAPTGQVVPPVNSAPANVAMAATNGNQTPVTQQIAPVAMPTPVVAPVANLPQTTAVAHAEPVTQAIPTAATLAEGEAVVEKPVPVKRKKPVKKSVAKAKTSTAAPEQSAPFVEEGVSQEEIIVFQKD